jgi:hypothetical protein
LSGYAKNLTAAAQKIIPVLRKLAVEDRFLTFDGSIDVPTRFFVPTQAGTKFQAEQALGDWAENTLRHGINNSSAGVKAVPFGYNSKIMAEDENFREEYIAGIIDTSKYGKRADLLLFESSADVPDDLTGLDSNAVRQFIPPCLGALEVRSSRLDAQTYMAYQRERKEEGKKPTFMEPNFTVKVEDLVKVFLWIHQNDKPQAYVQVFFDEIYAIGFLEVMKYIGHVSKLRGETRAFCKDHDYGPD